MDLLILHSFCVEQLTKVFIINVYALMRLLADLASGNNAWIDVDGRTEEVNV